MPTKVSPKRKPSAVAETMSGAVALWRNGQWWLQQRDARALQPASDKITRMLERARASGVLTEHAPGQFHVGDVGTGPAMNASESPLQRLATARKGSESAVLDADQLRAGETLRRDYERAHLSPRVTMRYDMQAGSGGRNAAFSDNHVETLSDLTLQARHKVHAALDAVGPELSGILLHVCCMEGGLEAAELRLSLPRRAGKAVLQLALTRLARHYGFKSPLRHAGPARIGHWAVDNFRPSFPEPAAHQP
jgi:hypothetical protein